MTDIWIVLVEDSSKDINALPFTSMPRAIEVARDQVTANASHPDSVIWDAKITPRAAADGVVFLAEYGEASCVSVIRRILDEKAGQHTCGEADCTSREICTACQAERNRKEEH